jgi:hypothetical protein
VTILGANSQLFSTPRLADVLINLAPDNTTPQRQHLARPDTLSAGKRKPARRLAYCLAEYKSAMDSISQFIEDECDVGKDHSYAASKFYQAYRDWCSGAGRKPQSQTAFKRSLEKLKGVYQHRSSNGLQWRGIQPCLTY